MEKTNLECPVELIERWPEVLETEGIQVLPERPFLERYEEARRAGLDIPLPTDEEIRNTTAVICRLGLGTVNVVGGISDYGAYTIDMFPGNRKSLPGEKTSSRESLKLAKRLREILIEHGAKPFRPWEKEGFGK